MMKSWIMASAMSLSMLAGAGAGTANAQEVKLTFATATPPTSNLTSVYFADLTKRFNEANKGVIQFDKRDGIALANTFQMYDRIISDIVQVGWTCTPTIAGKFPKSDVMGIPGLYDDSETGSLAFRRLYDSGMLDQEFDQIHPIVLTVTGHNVFHLSKKPDSLQNLNGLKIGASTLMVSKAVERLGGTPVSTSLLNSYEGLQRKNIDAHATSWNSVEGFKLFEVAPYHIAEPVGSLPCMVFMSKARYNALPPAAKAAIDKFSNEAESRIFGQFWDWSVKTGREFTEKAPNQVILTLSDAERDAWMKALQPIQAEFVATVKDGDKALAFVQKALTDLAKK